MERNLVLTLRHLGQLFGGVHATLKLDPSSVEVLGHRRWFGVLEVPEPLVDAWSRDVHRAQHFDATLEDGTPLGAIVCREFLRGLQGAVHRARFEWTGELPEPQEAA